MRSSSYSVLPARGLRTAVVLALTAGLATAVPAAHAAGTTTPAAPAATAPVAAKPYMGWSSWSMQSSKYPGLNPDGDYSYLTEANVLKQTDALASKLKRFGYEYVNIDAGWWRDNAWKPEFDQYARQTTDPVRFPHGMKWMADRIHAKGLKAGIYLPVGLEKEGYNDGRSPIWNAPGCTTADVVYGDLRTTNGWDSAYKLDFSRPCAEKYIESQAQLIAGWGYDFLKL
ncbi:carbohydrate-binding protein, partial [Streptomyces sp. NPDC026672]